MTYMHWIIYDTLLTNSSPTRAPRPRHFWFPNYSTCLKTTLGSAVPVWMSHVTHMYESCCMHEWVMSYELDVSHVRTSHVVYASVGAFMNELFQHWVSHNYMTSSQLYDMTRKKSVSAVNIYMSHVTHRHQAYHAHEWVMSHI